MKIYEVTTGSGAEGNEYRTEAYYFNKTSAEEHLVRLKLAGKCYYDIWECETDDEPLGGDIEEWEVNDIGSDRDSGRTPFAVRMLRNGTPIEVYAHSPDYTFSSGRHYYFDHYPAGRNLVNTCFATGEQEAVKITNELRAVILSENEWGVD